MAITRCFGCDRVARRLGFTIAVLIVMGGASRGDANPAELTSLIPAADARQAIAIGPHGELYEPDGTGSWVRTRPVRTSTTCSAAGRAGAAIVASCSGAMFRLAPSGWTAIRLSRNGKPQTSVGTAAVGAVGRQLFALDRMVAGTAPKLTTAPAAIAGIGAGPSGFVVATEQGLFRWTGAGLQLIPRVPRQVLRMISERWALVDGGALDLKTGRITRWPQGLAISGASPGPQDALVAVGATDAATELVTVRGGRIAREPIEILGGGAEAVGVVIDRAGRAVVALRDGRLAVRDQGRWTSVTVREQLPPAAPGAAPATSR
ncbi:MAG: hypothetical protein AB7O24_22330 [Kofleriaceae bacterium]